MDTHPSSPSAFHPRVNTISHLTWNLAIHVLFYFLNVLNFILIYNTVNNRGSCTQRSNTITPTTKVSTSFHHWTSRISSDSLPSPYLVNCVGQVLLTLAIFNFILYSFNFHIWKISSISIALLPVHVLTLYLHLPISKMPYCVSLHWFILPGDFTIILSKSL